MALENFHATAQSLSDAADALINKSAADAGALAQAQSDLAAVDQEAAGVIQPILDKINTAINPPQ